MSTRNIVRKVPNPEYGSRAYAMQSLRRALSLLDRAAGGGARELDAETVDPYFAIGAAKVSLESAIEMLSQRGCR